MFMANTGVNLMHVSYKGSGQSVRDAVSGEIQVAFDTVPTVLGYIKAGRLRPLAVMAPKRVAALPDVPTVLEAGVPGAEGLTWYGLYGPAGMPPEIITRLNTEVTRILKLPDIRARLDGMGAEDTGAEAPQDMAVSVRAEITRYNKLARDAGIKAEQ
jgi:tripartite-type tricarboxylate transporter receptor subunit TctC